MFFTLHVAHQVCIPCNSGGIISNLLLSRAYFPHLFHIISAKAKKASAALRKPLRSGLAVIVRNSKPLGFCFGKQESEPHPRNQMSDRPAHSSHTFFLKVFRIIVTHYFSLDLKTLETWVRNLAHLLCSSIYAILKMYLAHFT